MITTNGASTTGFGDILGSRIQEEHRSLSMRWLDRLKQLVPLEPNDIFPSDDLLDHIPALVSEVGAYLRAPEQEEIAANANVIVKARELGELRHQQRASVHQLLREYDILGAVLEAFAAEETARMKVQPQAEQCVEVMARMNRSIRVLMQTTVDTFVSEYMEKITTQTRQLEQFNRMLAHELRNPLVTLQFSVSVIKARQAALGESEPLSALVVIARNVDRMAALVTKMEQLSRAGMDTPSQQEVHLTAVAQDAVRQLRDMADSRGVEIRVEQDLPVLKIDVARLELILMNLISNAIKYSDPAKPERLVFVEAGPTVDERDVAITVRDNGLGIPEENLDAIFERFFRAHRDQDEQLANDGAGLGLSIVRECVASLGGRISVASTPGEGTSFVVELPAELRK